MNKFVLNDRDILVERNKESVSKSWFSKGYLLYGYILLYEQASGCFMLQ